LLKDEYGICFVDNVPINPQDTRKLGERISFIRETHYGRFWDFTANMAHGDTAYTPISLPTHTDTTYFTDPIGLQMFHVLKFEGIGGESIYIDGFNAALQLKQQDLKSYKTLSTIPLKFHCAGDENVFITPTPNLNTILKHDENNQLIQIRFNNTDRSIINHLTANQVQDFYHAYEKWLNIIQDSNNEFIILNKPGRVVIMNNWRVLHGRNSFKGFRRLCGSYINYDDYKSRLNMLLNNQGNQLKNDI
jgi:trimethyllysine dioxygenase